MHVILLFQWLPPRTKTTETADCLSSNNDPKKSSERKHSFFLPCQFQLEAQACFFGRSAFFWPLLNCFLFPFQKKRSTWKDFRKKKKKKRKTSCCLLLGNQNNQATACGSFFISCFFFYSGNGSHENCAVHSTALKCKLLIKNNTIFSPLWLNRVF